MSDLDKCKVADLKKKCKEAGVAMTGEKPDLVARLHNLTVTATRLVAAVDDISSAPRLGDAYETSARLAAGPARVCYTHRMRACAWDAWPTPLV